MNRPPSCARSFARAERRSLLPPLLPSPLSLLRSAPASAAGPVRLSGFSDGLVVAYRCGGSHRYGSMGARCRVGRSVFSFRLWVFHVKQRCCFGISSLWRVGEADRCCNRT